MANKQIKTRIQVLGGTSAEWSAKKSVVLLPNEFAVTWTSKNADGTYAGMVGIKMGDGVTTWENLKYLDQDLKDAIDAVEGDVEDIIGELRLTITDDGEAEKPTANTVAVYKNLTPTETGLGLVEELVEVATEAGVDAAIDEINIFDPAGQVITSGVGGIAANTDLTGKTTHEILTMLLYPYTKPVIGTVSTNAAGGTFEQGTTKTVTTVTVNFTKKSKPITKVTVYKGSTNIGTIEGTNLTSPQKFSVPADYQGTSNGTQFKATVTDEQGGTSGTGTATGFTYVYPYYYGVCAPDATIDEALVESLTKKVESKGTKTWTFNGAVQRMVIAYPTAHKTLKKVTDTGTGLDSTGVFGTPTTVSVTGLDGSTQSYYVYCSNNPIDGSFTMKFEHN